jgi:poly(A) polymerase/tRNA nucleotidyltransferase (CCA-adding enzyme)
MLKQIPNEVQSILRGLEAAGKEAAIVGGCVRDLLRDEKPKDWDVTTNATPEEIQKIFPDHLYENRFGTVTVHSGTQDVEVTPYRSEARYTDKRHPDRVTFGGSLLEDLGRRDFTINAMAMGTDAKVMDPYDGQKDLEQQRIRAVGDPRERFSEDALRLLRAIRFAAQLKAKIEPQTWNALVELRENIRAVAGERIRDELVKMVSMDHSILAMWKLLESGLLDLILPELTEGVGMTQNKHHIYTVFFHNVMALQHCPSDDPMVRLAALFHDIGKPRTKSGDGPDSTFYHHDHVGAEMTRTLMKRLRFSNEQIERVSHLVDMHLFHYSVGEITDNGVRRLLRRVGVEHMDDLLAVRIADRMGSGCQVEVPYKLQELQERIIEVQKDPIDTRMLEVDGHDVMKLLKIPPGPKIGEILNALLEEILDDPKRNTREDLEKRIIELGGD